MLRYIVIDKDTKRPDWVRSGLIEGLGNKDKMLITIMYDIGYYVASKNESKYSDEDLEIILQTFFPLVRRIYFTHFKSAYKEFINYNSKLIELFQFSNDQVINYNSVCDKLVTHLFYDFAEFYFISNRFDDYKVDVDGMVLNDYKTDAMVYYMVHYEMPKDIWG